MSADPAPRVRVVVVNYNGGELVERCVEHLLATEWPTNRLDVVVVDNASGDGSADVLAARFPHIRLIRSPRNLGFAGGNNLGLADLHGVDFVALVNPDAFMEPGWLRPLVEALQGDAHAGAANPKLLLEPRFARVDLRAEGFRPGGGDPRTLGVAVHGVRHAGADRFEATVFGEGFEALETAPDGSTFRWAGPEATAWLPVPSDVTGHARLEMFVAAEREKAVTLSTAAGTVTETVGPTPRWLTLEVAEPFTDLLNDAGSEPAGAFPANRGLGEPDDGRYDQPERVFAWTGSAVLLAVPYLRDVGLFDDRLFMYYEDFDLSCRGVLRGWHAVYVPTSRGRHVRGAVAGHRTALVDHHVQRNGLLVLVKNAPARVAWAEARRYLRDTWRMVRVEVVRPVIRGKRPRPHVTKRRTRVLADVVRRLPRALVERRRIGRTATRPRSAIYGPVGPSTSDAEPASEPPPQ